MANFTAFASDGARNECAPTNVSIVADQGEPAAPTSDVFARWIYLIVLIIGILGNLAFLCVAGRHKTMRSIINIYLANLAVADIVFLALNLVRLFLLPLVPLVSALKCTYQVLNVTLYFASMAIVSLVTLERYYAVCHPIKHRTMSNSGRSIKQVVAAWIFSLIFSVAVNIERFLAGTCVPVGKGSLENPETDVCGTPIIQNPESEKIVSDIVKVLPFMLAFFLNTGFYIAIVRSLKNRSFTQTSPVWVKNAHRSLTRTTQMVAVNTVVFFLCNVSLPVLVLRLYISGRFSNKDGIMGIVFSALMLMNSCINPFIYTVTNVRYRRAFIDVFFPCRRRTSSTSSTSTTNTPVVANVNSVQNNKQTSEQ